MTTPTRTRVGAPAVLAAARTPDPSGQEIEPAPLPGFVDSRFSPLVAAVAGRCLGDRDVAGERTGVLLGTTHGDATTADLASDRLVAGSVHNPLLFHQSVPTAVLGHLTREHGITGPLSCLSARDDLSGQLLASASLMLGDGLDAVLVIGVELAPTDRTARIAGLVPGDVAVALLLGPETAGARPEPDEALHDAFGPLAGLAALASLPVLVERG